LPIGPNADGVWVDINYTCPNCGRNLPMPRFQDKHCPNCGRRQHIPTEQERSESRTGTCPRCGAKVARDANYCIECGCRLKDVILTIKE